ncbi:MAG TPA: hypothetical protein VGC29_02965 [Flavisolibacter sp.]
MKKILSICLLALFANAASAQISRGQFLLGGNLSYTSKTQEIPGGDDYTTTTISGAPGFGYFFMNKLALGSRFSFTSTKVTGGRNERYVAAPFLRYYLMNKYSRFNFFLDGSYTAGQYKSGTVERKIEGYGVMGGPVVFLGSNVGLEFTVSYLADKMEGGNWFKTVQGGVGLQIHLGREKFKKTKNKKKEKEEEEEDDWDW